MLEKLPETRLQHLADAAEDHVRQAFGQSLNLRPEDAAGLPHFVIDHYRLWHGEIGDRPVTLVANRKAGQGATAEYLKHREVIRKQLGSDLIILLLDHAPKAIRQQMMERKIGFIAPGAQVYVPEILLDLRQSRASARPPATDQFSPTAQLVVLAFLQGMQLEGQSLTAIADALRVSVMSISRSLDELEALELARPHRVGRQRQLQLTMHGRELWDAVQSRLQSPERKTRIMRGRIDTSIAPLAGESALARCTMLAAPRTETRAVLSASWKRIAEEFALGDATPFDAERIAIQTWTYDPAILAKDRAIDRLSLYLTVRDSPDERIAQAADELLETFPW